MRTQRTQDLTHAHATVAGFDLERRGGRRIWPMRTQRSQDLIWKCTTDAGFDLSAVHPEKRRSTCAEFRRKYSESECAADGGPGERARTAKSAGKALGCTENRRMSGRRDGRLDALHCELRCFGQFARGTVGIIVQVERTARRVVCKRAGVHCRCECGGQTDLGIGRHFVPFGLRAGCIAAPLLCIEYTARRLQMQEKFCQHGK